MQFLPSYDYTRDDLVSDAIAAGRDAFSRVSDYADQASGEIEKFSNIFASALSRESDGVETARKQISQPASSLINVFSGKAQLDVADKDLDIKAAKIGQEEFSLVKKALAKLGMSDKELDEIISEIQSDSGLTWASFMDRIKEKIAALTVDAPKPDIDENRAVRILALLEKAGFNAKQAEEMLAKMKNGDVDEVLASLSNKLAASPGAMSFDAEDVEALGASLKLGDKAIEALKNLLAKTGRSEFSSEEVAAAMGILKTSSLAAEKKLNDAAEDVRALVAKALEKTAQRLESSQDDGDESSKKLIKASKDQTLAEAFLSKDDSASGEDKKDFHVADRRGENDAAAEARRATAKEKADRHGKENSAGKEAAAEAKDGESRSKADSKSAADKFREVAASRAEKAAENANSGRDNTDAGEGDEHASESKRDWESLLERLEHRRGGTREGFADLENEIAAQAQSVKDAAQAATVAEKAESSERADANRIMRQIEKGILTNLGQGRRQLTLTLKPENLGTLQVMLHVSGKDVRAVIRTESGETSSLVAEQLAQVRQALEQQGLKVQQLDVKTGIDQQYNPAQDFAGADDHNALRDQSAQREARNRMRLLRATGDAPAADAATGGAGASAATGSTGANSALDIFA